jgi:hypothetical protein
VGARFKGIFKNINLKANLPRYKIKIAVFQNGLIRVNRPYVTQSRKANKDL